MRKMKEQPKNQWSLALWLLLSNYYNGVTMVDAMKLYFHKFGSRLSEIEKGRKDKLKINRLPMTKKNRFGHVMTFTVYKSLANKSYLVNLYNKVNSIGIKALHH